MWHASSPVAEQGLSCSMARGILVPQPGNLSLLALEGGFLTTGPSGKTLMKILSYEQEQTLAFKLLNVDSTNGLILNLILDSFGLLVLSEVNTMICE